MGNKLAALTSVLIALAGPWSSVGAPPLDHYLALSVKPSTPIKHEVELKGPFDRERAVTLLAGPRYFCQQVGFASRTEERQSDCFNWYEIRSAEKCPSRLLSVRCSLTGGPPFRVVIGGAACLLSTCEKTNDGITG